MQIVSTDFPIGCSLREIDLDDNRITVLGSYAFARCGGTLEELYIQTQRFWDDSKLTSIHAAAFRRLSQLLTLKLGVLIGLGLMFPTTGLLAQFLARCRRMLIGACNPMVYPIRVCRTTGSRRCPRASSTT